MPSSKESCNREPTVGRWNLKTIFTIWPIKAWTLDGTANPNTAGNWNWYSNRNSCSSAHGAEINETKRYTKTPSYSLSTIHSSRTVPRIDFRDTLHVHKTISAAAVFTNPGEEHSRQDSKSHQITSRECFFMRLLLNTVYFVREWFKKCWQKWFRKTRSGELIDMTNVDAEFLIIVIGDEAWNM